MLRSNPPSKDGDDAAALDRAAAASTGQRDDERTVLFSGDSISADSPAPALPPQRFTLKSVLGNGGFGNVYLAYDEVLQRHVAVKTPCLGGLNEHELKQFVDEARTLARLVHPAIVSIYDVQITEDQNVSLIMEYLEGSSLQERIKRGPVPRDEAVALVVKVAEAVQHAHQQGFVHRDLKPSNILFDREGKPYVADFGLAVHESNQRKLTGEYSGTLPYMSPEQVRGETHHLDGRSDIWSIGVIIYELLAGCRPFKGETGDELRDEILNREPKPLRQVDASIPAELERTCLKCLAKPISSRYNSASELADDLRKCLPADGGGNGAMPAPVSPWRQFMAQANVGRLGCGLTVTLASLLFVVALVALPKREHQLAKVDAPIPPTNSKVSNNPEPLSFDEPAEPSPPITLPLMSSEIPRVPTTVEVTAPKEPTERIEWVRDQPFPAVSGGDPITASIDTKYHGSYLHGSAAVTQKYDAKLWRQQAALLHEYSRLSHLEMQLRRGTRDESIRRLASSSHDERSNHRYQLADDQFDRKTGDIVWPTVLQAPQYDALRTSIQDHFRQTVVQPEVDEVKRDEITLRLRELHKSLREDKSTLGRSEYIAGQRCLFGLMHEAKHRGSNSELNDKPLDETRIADLLITIARLVATSPIDSMRNGKRAMELATKACELTDYNDARAHLETLAAACAETGDFESAVKWCEKSLKLTDGDSELREQITQSLAAFKEKKTLRRELEPSSQEALDVGKLRSPAATDAKE